MKRAFTLAEVLITLGIIGVVATMTIPNLIATHQKKSTAAKLKKAVSTINQTIRMSEEENGEIDTWDKTLEPITFINKYLSPYMKITKICKTNMECGYKAPGNVWKHMNGTYNNYNSPVYQNRRTFITMDGLLYTYSVITNALSENNDRMIIIDINGSQGPNTHGKDVFFLYRQEENSSVFPYGANKTNEEIKRSCSKTGDGLYCAVLIQRNGWEIPTDYPWK